METGATPAGRFIVLEGMDGVGKTTQAKRLVGRLRRTYPDLLALREPGGTDLGDRVRAILLDKRELKGGLSPAAEFLLFAAARAEICRQMLEPALRQGRLVLMDRFTMSSEAYQGYGRGLSLELIRSVNAAVTLAIAPRLVVLLDMDPMAALARLQGSDRMEASGLEFFRRVRAGYIELAAESEAVVRVVNAARSVEEVEAEIQACVDDFLNRR